MRVPNKSRGGTHSVDPGSEETRSDAAQGGSIPKPKKSKNSLDQKSRGVLAHYYLGHFRSGLTVSAATDDR